MPSDRQSRARAAAALARRSAIARSFRVAIACLRLDCRATAQPNRVSAGQSSLHSHRRKVIGFVVVSKPIGKNSCHLISSLYLTERSYRVTNCLST